MFSEQSVDTCFPTPNSKNVTLPEGCVTRTTNSSIVDVGECKPVVCLKKDSSFNSSCQDPSFCCGARYITKVLVDCGDITSYNLTKVTHCSCGICIDEATVVEGIVVGGPEEKFVRYGDVIYDGRVVAKTDDNGKFFFTISDNKIKRVVVTFKDSLNDEYEQREKVIVMQDGSRVFLKIMLKRMPSPIVFNASEPLNISLKSYPNIDSFANLELQEESFLAENGAVFHGNARAMVSVTDPRNLSDVLTAPGDFTTTDEEGEVEMLETYGMVKMNFEDDSGNQLAMSKPMKVYLDPEKLNLTVQNASDFPLKLYWLDKKTERWREVGDFRLEDGSKQRRKRSNRVFFVGTVTPAIARERLNFDVPATQVALRVTTDPYPRNPESAGVVVRVIRQEGMVYRGYIEGTTTTEGLICIPIWRDKTCHIQAESKGKYMTPTRMGSLPANVKARLRKEVDVGTGTSIQWIEFKSILAENNTLPSPVYKDGKTGIAKCQSSETGSEGSQFTFREPQNGPADFSILTNVNKDFWIPLGCYIKIKLNYGNAIFAAESYKGNDLTETGKIGLHIRMSRTVTAGGSNIVCLQFSCPTKSAYTYVKIAPLTNICCLRSVHPNFSRVQHPNCSNGFTRNVCPIQPPAILGQEKWLWIPKSVNANTTYKTFSGKQRGEARCLVGDQAHGGTTTDTVTDSGYALEYDCR